MMFESDCYQVRVWISTFLSVYLVRVHKHLYLFPTIYWQTNEMPSTPAPFNPYAHLEFFSPNYKDVPCNTSSDEWAVKTTGWTCQWNSKLFSQLPERGGRHSNNGALEPRRSIV